MRRLSLNRSEPAKKSGQNIPKNRCRTTIAERMVETRAELPFIGDQIVCISHDHGARSGSLNLTLGIGRAMALVSMNFGPQNCGAVPGRLPTTRCGEDRRR